MSSTTIYAVTKRGVAKPYAELRNSWGSAALIWDYLIEKYFPLKPGQENWERPVGMFADMKPVWALEKRSDVPMVDRVALMTTFDNVMVKAEDLNLLADIFEQFQDELRKVVKNADGRVNHTLAQAKLFRQIAAEKKFLAICWQQTSVSDTMWWNHTKNRPYSINTGDKHWYLFDEVDEIIERKRVQKLERIKAIGDAIRILQGCLRQVTDKKGLAVLDAICCNYQQEIYDLQEEMAEVCQTS